MEPLWYKNAIIYAIDIKSFSDGNDDGVGDLAGVLNRLGYLAELGITCLWLLPFYPSPGRDNGYDVSDYYGIDPRLGTHEEFERLVHAAGEHGIRVIIDLVMHHTSNEHPWFKAACRAHRSRFRDYYVWSPTPPDPAKAEKPIFPGVEDSVWTYDDGAQAYYHHLFYHFEPSLRIANPDVRDEIERVMDHWLSFGISGFRVDAVSHMLEDKPTPAARLDDPHAVLRELRQTVERLQPDAILLGEADVELEHLVRFFGKGDELQMLFNFVLDNYLFLALARLSADPLAYVLSTLPPLPDGGQWANFLRNLDELDLERLDAAERQDVFAAFAPDESMRIYGRGIRRRMASMLDGDQRRLELAYSLLLSLPGAPMLVYGDEIGMGDDLSLPGREAVRTLMQWSRETNAGFSRAPADRLVRPPITQGPFGYRRLNVADQQTDAGSLLNAVKRLTHTRRRCSEIGVSPLAD